ncbi:hypothetical protein L1987_46862 [Smallanthus sonchifolius]|uniref:Uncharacterized protein n=1 Tax=Smallanthus sonchifolius TaxID=185202 RepID=A0ACB9G0S8_9ASTR|nr:hypothetical protein L1987_46862 [Smallanthus sonchifolius]
MASDMPETSKRQAWFCTTGLPSDVVVDVGDMTFHLHKFPLMAKSKRLHEMITEQERNLTVDGESDQDGDEDIQEEKKPEMETDYAYVTLPDFPGGSETFETAAKFCYAVKIEVSSANVAQLRCAGEVLEMTEEYCEDNLISKTERFLSQTVLRSLKESIKTLKSCEDLLPLAESLGIVQRCIDSIVSKASSSDPSLFGWPVNEVTNSGAAALSSHEISFRKKRAGGGDRWFDELVHLSPPFFKRLMSAIKSRDLNPEIIENCLISYAKTHIPGVNRAGRRSVDVYLKAHPWLTEADREKICGVMDCRKLTQEACTHAAQNERLPLRAVVQVLFFEQLQLRQAIAGTLMSVPSDMRLPDVVQQDESVVEGEVGRGVGSTWTAAVRENQVLRLDMDSMRTRVNYLERECSTMRKAIEKIDKVEPSGIGGWRGSLSRKFGCKFKTQVCDSHEPTVVEARKGRTHRLHKRE